MPGLTPATIFRRCQIGLASAEVAGALGSGGAILVTPTSGYRSARDVAGAITFSDPDRIKSPVTWAG
jgi:hypothetical protein